MAWLPLVTFSQAAVGTQGSGLVVVTSEAAVREAGNAETGVGCPPAFADGGRAAASAPRTEGGACLCSTLAASRPTWEGKAATLRGKPTLSSPAGRRPPVLFLQAVDQDVPAGAQLGPRSDFMEATELVIVMREQKVLNPAADPPRRRDAPERKHAPSKVARFLHTLARSGLHEVAINMI